MEPTDAARVTGPWLARIAREAGAAFWSPGKSDIARVTGPWLARIADGRRSLAGLAAVRMCLRPSALTGAVGKRGRQSRDAQRRSAAQFTLYAGCFFARLEALASGLMWWGGDRGRNARDRRGRERQTG